MRPGRAVALGAALAAAWVLAPGLPIASCAAAADHNSAGLLVEFADGSSRSVCVAFSEPSITGLDLLRRAGLDVSIQDYGGGSATVCRIESQGCDFPGDGCFCGCRDPAKACEFWGYYTFDRPAGRWSLSVQGAGTRVLRDGDVDGWRWGIHAEGAGPPSDPPGRACTAAATRVGATPALPERAAKPSGAVIAVLAAGVGALGASVIVVRRRRGPA